MATIKVGISSDKAREINKLIKEKGPKGVSSQTQGDSVRVSSKKRDDLQAVMAAVKAADLGHPRPVREHAQLSTVLAPSKDVPEVTRGATTLTSSRAGAGGVRARATGDEGGEHDMAVATSGQPEVDAAPSGVIDRRLDGAGTGPAAHHATWRCARRTSASGTSTRGTRTWNLVLDAAHGLLALGVDVGDRVSIHAEDRPEWVILDLATVAVRGDHRRPVPDQPRRPRSSTC